jgi:hypothetical protein
MGRIPVIRTDLSLDRIHRTALAWTAQAPGAPMNRIACLTLTLLLAACGAEVAGTAATVGKLQATSAEQARQTQRKIEADLGAALEAGKARTDAAAEQ